VSIDAPTGGITVSEHVASRPTAVLIAILALLLSLLAILTITERVSAQSDFFVELSGAAEVPGPGDPDGGGGGSIFVDPAAGEVCAFIEVFDIAPAAAAHIHAGAAGVAGSVVVTLPTPNADGIADGCVSGLDTALLQGIHDTPSDYYVNVHTADFPDGAVRGQLELAPVPLHANLSGEAEVPGPGDPDGGGIADLSISVSGGEVCGFIAVDSIATATAAHIHAGAAGAAGPVVVTLLTPGADGVADGCVSGVDPAVLQAILDAPSEYYVNVHNAEFPDGAVRGQLGPPPLQLFAGLSGGAEVPGPGDPDGGGFAVVEVFLDLGQICGFTEVSGIAPATAAHIHAGAAGVAGPVVITLPTPNADGLGEGCVDGLDPALLQSVIADPGAFYLNVHTADYPDGAVRGQLSFEPPPPPDCAPGVLCNGILSPGTYTYTGFGTDVTFTTVDEWSFVGDSVPSMNLFALEEQGGLFAFPFGGAVFSDPCDEGSVVTIGDGPAETMDWLGDRGFLELTEPIAVTYGGASGLQVDLVSATTPPECDEHPVALVFSLPDGNFFFFETGSTGRIIALDVAGETILVILEHVAAGGGDPGAFLARAQDVVNSFVWALGGTPPPPSPAPPAPPAPTPPRLPNTAADPVGAPLGVGVIMLGAGLTGSAIVLAGRRRVSR